MPEPTIEELIQSLDQLKAYSARLKEEVLKVGQKLRMPQDKVNAAIENNNELINISKVIKKLSNEIKRKECGL